MTKAETEIKFECPECTQHLLVDAAGTGLAMVCPTCRGTITVPRIAAESDGRRGGFAGMIMTPRAARPEASGVDFQTLRGQPIDPGARTGKLERELAEARAETGRLRRQSDAAGPEGDRLAVAAAETERELSALLSGRKELEAEAARDREQATIAGERVSTLERDLTAVRSDAAAVEKALAEERVNGEMARHEAARLRAALGEAQAAVAAAQPVHDELARAERQAEEAAARLEESERSAASLTIVCEEQRREVTKLREEVASSKRAKEVRTALARAQELEKEVARAAAGLVAAQAEGTRLVALERQSRAELQAALARCEEAERRAAAASEAKVHRENEVLRGILSRQKAELAQRYAEVIRLRRTGVVLKLIYGAVALGILAVIGLAVKVLPLAFR